MIRFPITSWADARLDGECPTLLATLCLASDWRTLRAALNRNCLRWKVFHLSPKTSEGLGLFMGALSYKFSEPRCPKVAATDTAVAFVQQATALRLGSAITE